MKITGLTIRILDVPVWYKAEDVAHILSTRDDEMKSWHYPLVTVHTDEGVDGYTMGYDNHGDGRAIACILRDMLWPEIRGENPLHTERLWQKLRLLNRHLYALTDAMSGMLDVAFWDIAAQAAGLPLYQFIGECRTNLPVYASSLFMPTTEDYVKQLRAYKNRSFPAYKAHPLGPWRKGIQVVQLQELKEVMLKIRRIGATLHTGDGFVRSAVLRGQV